MIGYGLAKAAVHHLASSLAEPESGMPPDSCVITLLFGILDTPANRKWMSKEDSSTWTPLDFINR
ncbi:Dihydropteridine reductase [Echinococcus granulosus]|uniref:Dihydropteridine reductase n=2 Tax=Echinococcus TaxID=6209 RepID=W6U7T9_ECHGR|nr:Dihydropteridine reductase [Echinococcus granulosus]EUB57250.1 Dihydropteridine reductase [Echinococcus granulosus]